MNTSRCQIEVSGIAVQIVRKNIKNLHVGVYPPDGRVRVAAPLQLNDDAVRIALVTRLGWIKRQRSKFNEQERQSRREMVSGETHYFSGRPFRLKVIERDGPQHVRVLNNQWLELSARPGATALEKEHVLVKWYRDSLREAIPPLLQEWENRIGVHVNDWRIRKMKTRWGGCNAEQGCMWLNLELAKKPSRCLEYIIVHEMVHLIERHHNERFAVLMNQFLPQWQLYKDELNRHPLGHADWDY